MSFWTILLISAIWLVFGFLVVGIYGAMVGRSTTESKAERRLIVAMLGPIAWGILAAFCVAAYAAAGMIIALKGREEAKRIAQRLNASRKTQT